ncbi:MAG: hypothetical protein K0Q66_1608 [Chitinophagaceae bacterium]|jgi:hypothetical protein|nr:hypothetical protein [Chitinophagaceae bacterium]
MCIEGDKDNGSKQKIAGHLGNKKGPANRSFYLGVYNSYWITTFLVSSTSPERMRRI